MNWVWKYFRIRRGFLYALFALLAISTVVSCNSLFYYPDKVEYQPISDLGCEAEDVYFESASGSKLHGWFLHSNSKPAKGTVIHFHGNAQNLSSHVGFVDWLPDRGFNVFAFDYSGYGKSEGSACRENAHNDGVAALRYVRTRDDIDKNSILVFGQSLGGAISLAILGESEREGIRGIAIDSSFPSYQDAGNAVLGGTIFTYPLAWLLLSSEHDPVDNIANISPIPLLFFHGDADQIVPYQLGQKLYRAAKEPKEFVTLEKGKHTSAMHSPVQRDKLVEFFESALAAE